MILNLPNTFQSYTTVNRKSHRYLNDSERHEAYNLLLSNTNDEKLRRGAVMEAAEKFDVHRHVISELRRRVSRANTGEDVITAINRKNRGNSGRPSIPENVVWERVQGVFLRFRHTLPHLAAKSGISKSTVCLAVKDGRSKVFSKRSWNTMVEMDTKSHTWRRKLLLRKVWLSLMLDAPLLYYGQQKNYLETIISSKT